MSIPEKKPSECGSNSVFTNGEAIFQARKARKWTRVQLAQAAGMCSRTIDSAEEGRCCYTSTVKRLAEVLRVDPKTLIHGEFVPEPEMPHGIGTHLKFPGDYKKIDETHDVPLLLESLMKLAGSKNINIFISIRPGESFWLDLIMTPGDALRLLAAHSEGLTKELGITELRFDTDPLAAFSDLIPSTIVSPLPRIVEMEAAIPMPEREEPIHLSTIRKGKRLWKQTRPAIKWLFRVAAVAIASICLNPIVSSLTILLVVNTDYKAPAVAQVGPVSSPKKFVRAPLASYKVIVD